MKDLLSSTVMSSLEIAELTGKRHDHVMFDIRKMLEELGNLTPDFSGVRKVRGKEYECFNLPKRETLILVSGYDVVTRAPTFLGTQPYGNNNSRSVYNFPKREACLVAMSYSYELQAVVLILDYLFS